MRTLAFVGLIVVIAVAVAGSMILVVGLAVDPSPVGAALAATGVGAFLLAATLEASSHATWTADASAESRRSFQRLRVGVVVVALVSAALVTAAVLVMRAPIWVAAPLVALGVASTIASPRIGARFRVRQAWSRGDAFDSDLERRALRRIAITFVVTLVLATTAFLVLELAIEGGLGGLGQLLLLASGLALVAAGFVGTFAMLPAHRRLRAIAAGDLARSRRLVRAVLRRRSTPVGDDERPAALDYARVASVAMVVQGLSTALLCFGLALMQIPSILDRPDDSLFATIVAVWLVAIAVAFIPLTLVQRRRAQRYVATHESSAA